MWSVPEINLTEPTELSTSPRDWDGSLLALAKTVDGGSAVVVWKDSSWVFTDAVSVSKVLSLPEASTSSLSSSNWSSASFINFTDCWGLSKVSNFSVMIFSFGFCRTGVFDCEA